jgi:uncharacterized protein YegP (UPF0339 family)
MITVTLIQTPRSRWWIGKRWQAWRWVAKAANGKVLATSAESYVNRADAIDAIFALFSQETGARYSDGYGPVITLRKVADV